MSAVYPWCVTLACDLSCSWCGICRDAKGEDCDVSKARFPDLPEEETLVARLHGGDPFRYGDLVGWSSWVRNRDNAVIEVEGPGHSLSDPEIRRRLKLVEPDLVRVMFPCADDDQARSLIGVHLYISRSIEGIGALLEMGMAVACVFPVNTKTVSGLGETISLVAERFQGKVPIILKRKPIFVEGKEPGWEEVEGLRAALISLPQELPGGTQVRFDQELGYGACLLPEGAWRKGLFARASKSGERPLRTYPAPDICRDCQWSSQCQWWTRDSVPTTMMTPVGSAQSTRLAAFTGVQDLHIAIPKEEGRIKATFETIELALEHEIEVTAVFSIAEKTVGGLAHRVMQVAERFGSKIPLVLRSSPEAHAASPWGKEVAQLGKELSDLPDSLAGGASVVFDSERGYGACVLPERAWRPGLFPLPPNENERPLRTYPAPELCGGCQWMSRCEWWVGGKGAMEHMVPLSQAQAEKLAQESGGAQDGLSNIFREAGEDWRTGRLNAACMQYRLAIIRGGTNPRVEEAREMLVRIDEVITEKLQDMKKEIEQGRAVEGMKNYQSFICEHVDIPLVVESIETFAALSKNPKIRHQLRARLGGPQNLIGDRGALSVEPRRAFSQGFRAEITPDDSGLAPALMGMATSGFAAQCCIGGVRSDAFDAALRKIEPVSSSILQGPEEIATDQRAALIEGITQSCASYPVLRNWLVAIAEAAENKADWNAALRFLERAKNIVRCRWVLLEVITT